MERRGGKAEGNSSRPGFRFHRVPVSGFNLQDCLYLAAARRLDASLITADKKFRDRAAALDKRISLLAGYEGN